MPLRRPPAWIECHRHLPELARPFAHPRRLICRDVFAFWSETARRIEGHARGRRSTRRPKVQMPPRKKALVDPLRSQNGGRGHFVLSRVAPIRQLSMSADFSLSAYASRQSLRNPIRCIDQVTSGDHDAAGRRRRNSGQSHRLEAYYNRF